MSQIRYALYYVPPPESALAAFGRAWLGHDIESGAALPPRGFAEIAPDRVAEITAEPRRYGFHATLKPPFVLADGTDEAELVAATARLARATPPPPAQHLALAAIAGFLALIPRAGDDGLAALAASCVEGIDRYRRPAAAAETARRRVAGLSARQEALLVRYGYPYVLDEFRFHMTLTQRLRPEVRAEIEPALAALVVPLIATPLSIGDIALCREEAGSGFSVRARVPLGSA